MIVEQDQFRGKWRELNWQHKSNVTMKELKAQNLKWLKFAQKPILM